METIIIQKDLLHNECCNCARQLLTLLHYAQAQRDYLSLHQEVYGIRIVTLHKRTNHPQTSNSQVLKSLRLVRGVQERVEKQWKVRLQEVGTSLLVEGEALQKS